MGAKGPEKGSEMAEKEIEVHITPSKHEGMELGFGAPGEFTEISGKSRISSK